ncbi:MAG: response regulator [Geobacter sp.]|nr:MAG: response regulator [Geobacter sp.]
MELQQHPDDHQLQEMMSVRLQLAALKKKMTRQNKSLESLKEEKVRLSVTLRSISEGVITTDMNGRIVFLNAVAKRLIDCPKDKAVGRLLSGVIHVTHEEGSQKNLGTLLDTAMITGRVIELAAATTLVSSEGKKKIVSISVSPLHDRNRMISGVVLVLRDITEKKALENELFKVQKLESLGLLAGGIAHDFNNILTAILANISLAKCLILPSNTAHTRLDQAEKAAGRAADLARQLLTFAKGGKPIKKTVAPAKLLVESANFALHGANVSCEFSLPDDLWAIEADPGQINQVVNNLVVNAVQAMTGGGHIRISSENIHFADKNSLPLGRGRYVRISVKDSGVGIPEEIRQMIFDPYFTTKPYGNGLGLATTYSIIRNHGGHITVASTPGKGTTFMIYLPASDKNPTEALVEDVVLTGNSGKILVMDDNEMIRNVATEMARHMGYQPVSCESGDKAVSLYRAALKSGETFHAVILDLTIPGGMGGQEALQHLIALDPGVRAIASSGYSDCRSIAEFREHGFRGVLPKPYTIRAFHRALYDVL